MSNETIHFFLIFVILVSLLQETIGEEGYSIEQSEATSKPKFENNVNETIIGNIYTTDITIASEMFDDNELKKLFLKNYRLLENLERDRYTIDNPDTVLKRTFRNIANSTVPLGMACFTCYGNGSSKNDLNCYKGVSVPLKKCADAEHCYIEFNPRYIKRGCMLPGRVNRTFICKCPLCNDKPSFDTSYYQYKMISEWEYDNARLQMPLQGMDLMCKVCETKGTNPTSDKNCRFGKNADYMVCSRNQLCYTNIDDETDFVSRGCIEKPLFNSIYFFCNYTECNTNEFYNPRKKVWKRAQRKTLKYEEKFIKENMNSSTKIYKINCYLSLLITIMTFIDFVRL